MRNKERIKKILNLLEKIWDTDNRSDQRFGQLLINLGVVEDSMNVWSNEDDTFEDYLKAIIKEDNKK